MAFFKDIGKNLGSAFRTAGGAVTGAVSGAAEAVADKNRRLAQQNRLRAVIRSEEKNAERAYLALGRYYYHNLRDTENTVTEPYCVDVDTAARHIDAAVAELEALREEEPQTEVEGDVEIVKEDDGPTAIFTRKVKPFVNRILGEKAPAEETLPEEAPAEEAPAQPETAEPEVAAPAPAEEIAAPHPETEGALPADESDSLPFEG